MKNTIKNIAIFSGLLASANMFSQEVIILQSQLPPAIMKYVMVHFPDAKFSSIMKEIKATKTEYDLRLDNGTKLEFNNNMIKEIESSKKLPNSVIPKNILNYVSKNYPETFVTEWKIDNTKQKIELNTGVELEFTRKGEFLRVD